MKSADHDGQRRGTRRRDLRGPFLRVLRSTSCAIAAFILVLRAAPDPLLQDKGAAGAWQRLLKLQTTASVMHTTAHPDDEHGGLLAQLSRGQGVRVSLLTLTRGEGGDNAIGSELFDAVGLIRTEELLQADRYYGVDRQYFTAVVDYGFSKRLDEALEKWGRDNLLRDVVRIIRMDRPLVLISRFQGNARDGHGNHQAAGLITQEAFKAAGDPTRYPEQLRDGLRPWQPRKLYIGGVRENEDWTIRADTAEYSPWLGDTYQGFARLGLAFQRSQNGGRVNEAASGVAYYKRIATAPAASASGVGTTDLTKERTFFDGIDTSLPAAIAPHVQAAVQAFAMQNPSASVPALARGLAAARKAMETATPDARLVLQTKEQQFVDAINAALGIELEAIAAVPGPVTPGQSFEVRATLANRGAIQIQPTELTLMGAGEWQVRPAGPVPSTLEANQIARRSFAVTLLENAPLTRPYFNRASIADAMYQIRDVPQAYRPAAEPTLTVRARYLVDGVAVNVRSPVVRREPHLPYGDEWRELAIVPALAVNVSPRVAVVPLGAGARTVDMRVEVVNNLERGGSGQVTLKLPAGWTAAPPNAAFSFNRAGERASYRFTVSISASADRDARIEVSATVGGHTFGAGYDVLEHRDLETRYLYHPAVTAVRMIDVKIAPALKVGYVMGIGDDVPSAIGQLGAAVTLLGDQDLAARDLHAFDAIVIGTRAYAVRDDLKTYNARLLDYAKAGGNLIVLYNTQEFVPAKFAPFPGQLPPQAEEVSEEDSPVEILAPTHKVLNTPNRITNADFDGWIEQRGSKFFTEWDAAYTPIISTHDQGQPPQKGGWLAADYGKGHYTYFAYAFHRQLPYGVPGAYRLLANLLSLGR